MSKCKGCFNEHSAPVIGKGVCADCKESTPMTDQEMLKEWVQAGKQGMYKTLGYAVAKFEISYDAKGNPCVWLYSALGDRNGFSIPDLIADGGFMKAVYGDDKNNACQLKSLICENCPMPKQHGIDFKHCGFINYIYHSMLAVRLLVTGGNAVKYLWENMKKETL